MSKRTVSAANSTKTIFSGDAYCTGAQFVQRYDARSLAQILSDTGIDIETVTSDLKLAAILKEASGKVEAAACLGEAYTADDLTALAADTSNMAEMLHGLVATLAIQIIYRRRPDFTLPYVQEVQEAERFLSALAVGQKIFGFLDNMEAGHLDHNVETPQDVENRNLWTYQARRFFGTRGNRMPRGA